MQIVWFKRDLRVFDNEAFTRACDKGLILPLYIFEEELWQQTSMSIKHYRFLEESLKDLNNNLEKLGQGLIIEKGNCIDIFKKYKDKYHLKTVWSHQETWNNFVRNRNAKLSNWFVSNNIIWIEVPQNGVIRNLKTRDGWAKKWNIRMNNSLFSPIKKLEKISKKKI